MCFRTARLRTGTREIITGIFVFVYDLKVKTKGKDKEIPKWWQELLFVKKKKDFRDKDYGWNEDFMRDLGLIEHERTSKKKEDLRSS